MGEFIYVTKTGRIEDCAKQFAGCVNGQKNDPWNQQYYNITLRHVFQTRQLLMHRSRVGVQYSLNRAKQKHWRNTLEIVSLEELNRK